MSTFVVKIYVDGTELPQGVEVEEGGLAYPVSRSTVQGKTALKRSGPPQPVALSLSLPLGSDLTLWDLMREQKPRTLRVVYCADQGGPDEDGTSLPPVPFKSVNYTEMIASFHKPNENGRELITFTSDKPYVVKKEPKGK